MVSIFSAPQLKLYISHHIRFKVSGTRPHERWIVESVTRDTVPFPNWPFHGGDPNWDGQFSPSNQPAASGLKQLPYKDKQPYLKSFFI